MRALEILSLAIMAASGSVGEPLPGPGNGPFQGAQGQTLPETGYTILAKRKVALDTEVRFKATFERAGEDELPAGECIRACNGQKHRRHEQCDLSCDSECNTFKGRKGNPVEIETWYKELGPEGENPPTRSHGQTLDQAYAKFNLPGTTRGDHALTNPKWPVFSGAHMGIFNILKGRAELVTPHWNTTPCSISFMYIKAAKYYVTVEFELVEIQGLRKELAGPKGTLRYLLLVPVSGQTRTSEPSVICNCELKQTVPADPPGHGFLPGRTGTTGDEYAWIQENGTRRPLTFSDLGGLVREVSVPNMNEAFFAVNSMPMGEAFIPAGWELECVRGGGQDVQLQEDLRFPMTEPWGHLMAGMEFEWPQDPQKRIRALCLEISKPEPAKGMTYRLKPPRHPALARLAQITRGSRIRGPWDQVRLWIATDHASFDEIAKVLSPMPGPGTYLRQLWLAAGVGAISPMDPKVSRLMENRFLLAENYTPEAVRWMLSEKLKSDAPAMVKWIRGQKGAIATLFEDGDPKDDAQLIGILASEFATAGGADGLSTALWLLSDAAPEAHRAAIAASNEAGEVANILIYVEDEKSATLLLDWFEKSKPAEMNYACWNVNPNLPNAIKERAMQLAGG